MAKAKHWTAQEIDDFAKVPDTLKATQLAIQLGGAVLLFWTAKSREAQ